MTTCTICQRPTDEREPIRHDRCAIRLRADLVAIPGLYALMGAVLAPGAAAGARVSGTRTAPLPVRLEPLSLRARGGIVTVMATWEADWRETRGFASAGRGESERDLAAIVLWLRAHLPWAIEQHPAIREFGDELRDVLRAGRVAAGVLPMMMRIGDCPAMLSDGEPCGTGLYADAYAELIQCRRCRATWRRPQWMLLGETLRGEEAKAASDSVVVKLSEGSIDFQGAEVSPEVAELAKVLNEPSGWSERLSA